MELKKKTDRPKYYVKVVMCKLSKNVLDDDIEISESCTGLLPYKEADKFYGKLKNLVIKNIEERNEL